MFDCEFERDVGHTQHDRFTRLIHITATCKNTKRLPHMHKLIRRNQEKTFKHSTKNVKFTFNSSHLIFSLEYTPCMHTFWTETHQMLIVHILVWPCQLERMTPGWSFPSLLTPVLSAAAVTGRKKEVVVPFASPGPLRSTETSCFLRHHFFCSHSDVCLSVWPFDIMHLNIFVSISGLLSPVLAPAKCVTEFIEVIKVKFRVQRCLHVPNDSKLTFHKSPLTFSFWHPRHFWCFTNLDNVLLTRMWWNLCYNISTSACHVGWNPKIRDTSPTWDTVDITFHLIKLFSWPLIINMWHQ